MESNVYCSLLSPYTSISLYVSILLRIRHVYRQLIPPNICYFMQWIFSSDCSLHDHLCQLGKHLIHCGGHASRDIENILITIIIIIIIILEDLWRFLLFPLKLQEIVLLQLAE